MWSYRKLPLVSSFNRWTITASDSLSSSSDSRNALRSMAVCSRVSKSSNDPSVALKNERWLPSIFFLLNRKLRCRLWLTHRFARSRSSLVCSSCLIRLVVSSFLARSWCTCVSSSFTRVWCSRLSASNFSWLKNKNRIILEWFLKSDLSWKLLSENCVQSIICD